MVRKTDRHDIDRREMLLIRAAHHLWRQSRQKGLPVEQRRSLYAALEILWAAKRELRAALAAARIERGRTFSQRMRKEAVA